MWVQFPSGRIFCNGKYNKKAGEVLTQVKVNYSDYLNEVTDEISFELLTDIILKLKYDKENAALILSMSDKITDNTELRGSLNLDGVNTLIKTLSVIRNQIKQNQ